MFTHLLLLIVFFVAPSVRAIDGWKKDSAASARIEAFVENARKEIPAADRIAVLDLDGTLIEETPAPVTLFQYWEAYRKWLPGYAGTR